jgi:hypothetical protein
VSDKEDLLAAARLTARPANTPQRTASLHTLPSNKFISKSKGDRIEHIHADPIVWNCLYEGDQPREKVPKLRMRVVGLDMGCQEIP